MTVEILFRDDHVLVVNKPAGVAVVFDRHRPDEVSFWQELWRSHGPVYVVHRLDRETTGALVFARSQAAQKALSQAFAKHRVAKIYHAVVVGVPFWHEVTAERPLRENGDGAHRTVVDWERGKPAQTRFRLLRVLPGERALVEASPLTGRRHQVRAHLAALGFPILGDALYGGGKDAPRPLLHARAVTFPHPEGEGFVEVSAPYPEDMMTSLGC
ncbi:MAG: RluA family pseudouridine synthase [Thermoanaerobaculum sp.]